MMNSFCPLELTINSKETRSQWIHCRLKLGGEPMKDLKNIFKTMKENIFRSWDVSIPTYSRSKSFRQWFSLSQSMEVTIEVWRSRIENSGAFKLWTSELEKLPDNTMDSQENRKVDAEQINQKFSFEAQIARVKLSHLAQFSWQVQMLEKE